MFRFALARRPLEYAGSSSSGEIVEPQIARLQASFGRRQISTPWTACGGFDVRYGSDSGPTGDRHVDRLLFSTGNEGTGTVREEWIGLADVTLGLRGGGAWNHRYTGKVWVVYVAVSGQGPGASTFLSPLEVAARVTGRSAGSGNVERVLGTVRFPGRRVLSAHVALRAFDLQYLDGDHHVQQIRAWLNAPRIRNAGGNGQVTVVGRFGMRGGGDFLQPFSAEIKALLFVEVAEAP